MRLNLFVFREPSLLELGVDEFTVDGNLESAPARGHQGEGLDVLLELLNDTFRHTDGLGFIASRRAVFDPDFGHLLSPPSLTWDRDPVDDNLLDPGCQSLVRRPAQRQATVADLERMTCGGDLVLTGRPWPHRLPAFRGAVGIASPCCGFGGGGRIPL